MDEPHPNVPKSFCGATGSPRPDRGAESSLRNKGSSLDLAGVGYPRDWCLLGWPREPYASRCKGAKPSTLGRLAPRDLFLCYHGKKKKSNKKAPEIAVSCQCSKNKVYGWTRRRKKKKTLPGNQKGMDDPSMGQSVVVIPWSMDRVLPSITPPHSPFPSLLPHAFIRSGAPSDESFSSGWALWK